MKNRGLIIITSIVIIIPILFGIVLWDKLPEEIAIHFNSQGEVDNYGSKALVVYYFPIMMLFLHLFLIFISGKDNRFVKLSPKLKNVILWIVPIIILFVTSLIYAKALGYNLNMIFWSGLVMSLFLISIGNYIPKCKQNSMMGIRNPWTLKSEVNWNRTHKFTGRLWVLVGLFQMIFVFINFNSSKSYLVYFLALFIAVVVFVPNIYSFWIYKKSN
ncbi:MAG: hemolysin expression modulating protein [Clostridiales bacterium]|nr:MAG: hemolysin expression modulating protein [Clostridiales bacterium]